MLRVDTVKSTVAATKQLKLPHCSEWRAVSNGIRQVNDGNDARTFMNNNMIEIDLRDTMTVTFPTMIETLIKLKAEREGTKKVEELGQYGQGQFVA